MKLIQYTNENKYKVMRYAVEHYGCEHVCLKTEANLAFEKADFDRFTLYHWDKYCDFYYVLDDLTKVSLNNFVEFKDFFVGIVVDVNDSQVYDIIANFCAENNKKFIVVGENDTYDYVRSIYEV